LAKYQLGLTRKEKLRMNVLAAGKIRSVLKDPNPVRKVEIHQKYNLLQDIRRIRVSLATDMR